MLVSLQTQSCYVDSSSRSYQEHVRASTFPLCDTGSIPQSTPYEAEFTQMMLTYSQIVIKVNRMQWSVLKMTSLLTLIQIDIAHTGLSLISSHSFLLGSSLHSKNEVQCKTFAKILILSVMVNILLTRLGDIFVTCLNNLILFIQLTGLANR